MDNNLIQDYLTNYKNTISPVFNKFKKNTIEEALKVDQDTSIYTEYLFTLAQKGKMIRGALTKLGYEIVTEIISDEGINLASLATELFHTGALIHDDIMDKSELRRGISSFHKYIENEKITSFDNHHFAISQAILAGDLSYFLAYQLLLQSTIENEYKLEALNTFTFYINRVVWGQMLDIGNMTTSLNNLNQILNIMKYKTAEYTAVMPLTIGANLAGCKNKELLNTIYEFGLSLGWIYQLRDDVLGVYGDEKVTGKSNYSDIIDKKKTILVMAILNSKKENLIKKYSDINNAPVLSSQDVLNIKELMDEVNAKKYANDLINKYSQNAYNLISKITSKIEKQSLLHSLTTFLLTREK